MVFRSSPTSASPNYWKKIRTRRAMRPAPANRSARLATCRPSKLRAGTMASAPQPTSTPSARCSTNASRGRFHSWPRAWWKRCTGFARRSRCRRVGFSPRSRATSKRSASTASTRNRIGATRVPKPWRTISATSSAVNRSRPDPLQLGNVCGSGAAAGPRTRRSSPSRYCSRLAGPPPLASGTTARSSG